MRFISNAILPFRRYAVSTGRASRSEFWSYWALNTAGHAITLALIICGSILDSDVLMLTGTALYLMLALATVIPTFTVTMRRLQDMNHTGAFVLLCFVPLGILVLMIWMTMPGTPGGNRFGPPPIP